MLPKGHSGDCCGYHPRALDTRMGTKYLMVPKVRQGGYIPVLLLSANAVRSNTDLGGERGLCTEHIHA